MSNIEDPKKGKDGPKFKFNDPVELQSKVDAYFESLKGALNKTVLVKGEVKHIECDKPATVEGLALFLDINPSTLWKYRKKDHHPNPEIGKIIKRAWDRIVSEVFEAGITGLYDTTFSIFYTKAALGFSDKKGMYEEEDQTSQEKEENNRQAILEKNLEEARKNKMKSINPEDLKDGEK